jgi:hypothetical protein
MSEAILLAPDMSSQNEQEQIYHSYIFKLDVYLQANVAHILYFLKAYCRSAQNMVMMMMMTMMGSRRRRGYLRTVTFESIYKTPHFLLYSSISVHCHSQQFVQAARQHVKSTVQKFPSMSFHW